MIMRPLSTLIGVLLIPLLLSCGAGKKSTDQNTSTRDSLSMDGAGAFGDLPYDMAFGEIIFEGRQVVTKGALFGESLKNAYVFYTDGTEVFPVSFEFRLVTSVGADPSDNMIGDSYKFQTEQKINERFGQSYCLLTDGLFTQNYSIISLKTPESRDWNHTDKDFEADCVMIRSVFESKYKLAIEDVFCCTTSNDGRTSFFQVVSPVGEDRIKSYLVMKEGDSISVSTDDIAHDRDQRMSEEDLSNTCFPYPSILTYLKGKDGSRLLILTDMQQGTGKYHILKIRDDAFIPLSEKPWKA